MNKKILTSLFALGLSLALAACGKPAGGGADESKVLSDPDNYAWGLHGPFQLNDEAKTINGWNGKADELYEASLMKAISIKEAKAIDAGIGEKLAKKNVKYLYKYEGAIFGGHDAGYTKKFKDAEGNLKLANGSFTFKAVTLAFEDDVYTEIQWIPHDHDGHCEDLSGNLFLQPFVEEPDDDGFSWNYDPVVRSGAGVYTIIVAQYKEISSATVPGYGLAVVKTGNIEGGLDYELPPTEKSYGVIGGGAWGEDFAKLTPNGDKSVWTATVELEAKEQGYKVRADNSWDEAYGFADLTEDSASSIVDDGGNFKITETGTYNITLTPAAAKPLKVVRAVA